VLMMNRALPLPLVKFELSRLHDHAHFSETKVNFGKLRPR